MSFMESPQAANRFLLVIVIFLSVAALKFAQPVIIALLLTVLLVYVMDPLVSFLQRRRVPLWAATAIAALLFFALFLGLALLLVKDLSHFGRTFPRFQDEIFSRAQSALDDVEAALGTRLSVNPFEELRTLPIGPGMLSAVRSAARFFSEFFLIFFFAIILLLGKHGRVRKLLTVFPRKHSMIPTILKHIDRHLRIFLGIKALASLAVGLGTSFILFAFRVEFSVTWGALTFLLNFIPTLGPIAAVILPFILSLVQFNSLLLPLIILGCLTILHVGVSSLLEPQFMGLHLNLSFFVIFLSLFFWGWLWGPAGVLLAVPVTTSLKILMERIPATARLALLLESARRMRLRRLRIGPAKKDGDKRSQ
jgi:predicted PurR-regulated permease PerM